MFHPAPQVNYYNETHALWEPLIEQVDREGHRWNLKLEVSKHLMFLFGHLFSVHDKNAKCIFIMLWGNWWSGTSLGSGQPHLVSVGPLSPR